MCVMISFTGIAKQTFKSTVFAQTHEINLFGLVQAAGVLGLHDI